MDFEYYICNITQYLILAHRIWNVFISTENSLVDFWIKTSIKTSLTKATQFSVHKFTRSICNLLHLHSCLESSLLHLHSCLESSHIFIRIFGSCLVLSAWRKRFLHQECQLLHYCRSHQLRQLLYYHDPLQKLSRDELKWASNIFVNVEWRLVLLFFCRFIREELDSLDMWVITFQCFDNGMKFDPNRYMIVQIVFRYCTKWYCSCFEIFFGFYIHYSSMKRYLFPWGSEIMWMHFFVIDIAIIRLMTIIMNHW